MSLSQVQRTVLLFKGILVLCCFQSIKASQESSDSHSFQLTEIYTEGLAVFLFLVIGWYNMVGLQLMNVLQTMQILYSNDHREDNIKIEISEKIHYGVSLFVEKGQGSNRAAPVQLIFPTFVLIGLVATCLMMKSICCRTANQNDSSFCQKKGTCFEFSRQIKKNKVAIQPEQSKSQIFQPFKGQVVQSQGADSRSMSLLIRNETFDWVIDFLCLHMLTNCLVYFTYGFIQQIKSEVREQFQFLWISFAFPIFYAVIITWYLNRNHPTSLSKFNTSQNRQSYPSELICKQRFLLKVLQRVIFGLILGCTSDEEFGTAYPVLAIKFIIVISVFIFENKKEIGEHRGQRNRLRTKKSEQYLIRALQICHLLWLFFFILDRDAIRKNAKVQGIFNQNFAQILFLTFLTLTVLLTLISWLRQLKLKVERFFQKKNNRTNNAQMQNYSFPNSVASKKQPSKKKMNQGDRKAEQCIQPLRKKSTFDLKKRKNKLKSNQNADQLQEKPQNSSNSVQKSLSATPKSILRLRNQQNLIKQSSCKKVQIFENSCEFSHVSLKQLKKDSLDNKKAKFNKLFTMKQIQNTNQSRE